MDWFGLVIGSVYLAGPLGGWLALTVMERRAEAEAEAEGRARRASRERRTEGRWAENFENN